MVTKSNSSTVAAQLHRYRRFRTRQSTIQWGPSYESAIKAVKGEAPSLGSPGTLPAMGLSRVVHAMSWPEKVAASLALYAGPFELHDQHVFYPSSMQHPLAYHPMYSDRPWPVTDGTFALAEKFGLAKFHPGAWDQCAVSSSADEEGLDTAGAWEIGAWIGDLLLYLKDEKSEPYILFWDVKDSPGDHGKPGGDRVRRLSASALKEAKARATVCAAYAEQLGSRVVDVSSSAIPDSLATTLVTLCRASAADVDLSPNAIADLLCAYKEGVGNREPANRIAKRVVSSERDLLSAKSLLEIAVWERRVRVDLHQPVLWDRPLLPERIDALDEFAHLFSRKCRG